MPRFPTGTVTFLFTDIEQSTRGWERDATAARIVVERHLELIRQGVDAHGGVHFKTVGDATQSAFATASRGVAGALDAQRALLAELWPRAEDRPRVRMALHAGPAEPRDGDYLAAPLNRLSRLLDAAHGEQILLSGTMAELARDSLPEGATLKALGEYQLRDIIQPEEIFQLCHPALRADFPPLNTPGYLPHNLPTHPTPFLGREREVEEVVALLLRPEVRLATLTGTGGVGKTRLGLRVAAEMLESFPGGVFLVDLARLTDPDLAPSATATALGLREQPGQTYEQTLSDYLREQQMLLLFDNFEHVLPAATLVADLLASSPGLKVLATSRARLGLRAEHEYHVEPLPIPDPEALPPVDELSGYDAVELFMSRAQALRPSFRLTNENARAVAEIVCRLDGLPLAIELAAAWVKLLSPQALVDRLDRRLSTLTGGARDLPARQRTLRDTIAWSYDLLPSGEQILFRQLSVFVGGWTIEAAEAMAALGAGEKVDALQVLVTLVDQSLVDERPTPEALPDEPRYGMLETVREFATDQLATSGDHDQAERAFEEFLIGKVEAAEMGQQGPDQQLWLDRLEAEHDNLRAALARAVERGDGAAIRLANRLWQFWRSRGYLSEGRSWFARALAAGAVAAEVRAAAEFGQGHLSLDAGDLAAARAHFAASLALREEVDDRQGVATALSGLVVVAVNRYAYDEARELGERALRLYREFDDERGVAIGLYNLAMIAREQGDLALASAGYDESLAVWRKRNEPQWTAATVLALAITRRMAGDVQQARTLLDEVRPLYDRLGDVFGLGLTSLERGHLARMAGDDAEAARCYASTLHYFGEAGANLGVVEAIEWLAATAAAGDATIPALQLFSAAEAARRALDLPPPAASDAPLLESLARHARDAAGTAADAAAASGATLTLEQARTEALAVSRALDRAPQAPRCGK